ncbi:ATP-binding protein [Schauerella aestuarii]|uniref:ATP-binding protein n=1 Tax=Schauerella aestuarii TaxID=2511204 RepID=UPI00136D5058|nr:ATP-binding protein [Achromobacter aestuarii]MYZ45627.1 response regulator [Achromobacter aestuarii]
MTDAIRIAVPYADIFVGDSEMANVMRRHDWAKTPLGPPEHWPQTLKSALRILLTSKFEMWVGWGPDVAFFYNDAYRPTLGRKHPEALARPTRDVWSEIWDDVKDRIHSVYHDGASTWDRALLLIIDRAGYEEETYHTFSYSPLVGDTGDIEGLFCAVSEDTDRVISERRLRSLRETAAAITKADNRRDLTRAVCAALGEARHDVPFAALYFLDDSGEPRLAGAVGVEAGHRLAPQMMWTCDAPPGIARPPIKGKSTYLIDLPEADDLPSGPWNKPIRKMAVVPLTAKGQEFATGYLVAGLNPYRPGVDGDVDFVELMAGQIAAAFDHIGALEVRTEERDRLRGLFQQSPGFICVLSGPNHRYELVNESYRRLVGRSDVEGLTARDILPQGGNEAIFDLLDEVYRTGRPFVGQDMTVMITTLPQEAPAKHYLDFVFQPIIDETGAVTGIFAEGYDVTAKVVAENDLRRINETLEVRIQERTADLEAALERLREQARERELVESALRQAQKMEAVGQLTGGLAHDFNNLLASVSGSLELMHRRLQRGETGDLERYIAIGQGATKRAAALTHRLLAFSRRQTLDARPTNVNILIKGMEDLIRRSIGPHVTVEVVGAAGLWSSQIDRNQLENALLNLCINASDAMPDGGRLTIETANKWMDERSAKERDLPPGQYISLCVTDTGTGMSPEVIARIFEPFYTTKPLGMGTGLGLSMVYGFARQSGGQVRAYSEVGMGTTLCIYLPRHDVRGTEAEPAPVAEVPPAVSGAGTVLLVDDETAIRALVQESLTEAGYTVIEADTGAAALTILQSSIAIDLLITDVGLPGGINGRQVADGGRQHRPELKVLFITGYAENAVIGNGQLEQGMHLLTKPFALNVLAERVGELMQHSDAA